MSRSVYIVLITFMATYMATLMATFMASYVDFCGDLYGDFYGDFYDDLSPFSTGRRFSRDATFSFVGVAYDISKCDADKGKSRFARKKSPSRKRALYGDFYGDFYGDLYGDFYGDFYDSLRHRPKFEIIWVCESPAIIVYSGVLIT